jgi:outer membrane protein OmpA-like peptidoglycan-associated protein
MTKTMMAKTVIALSLAATMAAGCATTDPATGERVPNRMATGAIIGAIGGAAVGSMAGGDDGRNAAVGAVVGAIAGGAVGAYMDRQERALREQLAGTGVSVERVAEDQIRLVMPSDITFDTAQATVRGEFQPILMDVSSVLEANPSTMIDVIGHADSRGGEAYNLDLSERRAFAVSSVLIQNGVQRERIVAYGRGELEPIADNATPQGQQLNRRVEIRVRAVTQR